LWLVSGRGNKHTVRIKTSTVPITTADHSGYYV
jgi:hypothetical protein